MEHRWRPYLTNVNSELASIRVDLALASIAPIQEKPWLFWIWLYFQSPRPDGLSSSEECKALWDIEDAFVAALNSFHENIFCGCITTLGRREFYFYAETDSDVSRVAQDVLKSFPPYTAWVGSQRDESWHQYLNVLYPSENQLDSISNADVLEVMAKEGDIHELPREVSHWIYFPTEGERLAFQTSIASIGETKIDILPQSEDGRYGIVITETHEITGPQIDRKTRALRAFAAEAGGEYDGWEAQVTVSGESVPIK
jgi:hypothetical protein